MNTDLHFSSETDEWATPQDFFDKWNSVFHFGLDACADRHNAKHSLYYTKEENALTKNWHRIANSVWMNPPYGREIGKWIRKAYEESCMGCIVVCLVPVRSDTKWWHDWCTKGIIRLVKGRLRFQGHHKDAPFPSAVVVFMGNLMNGKGPI